MYVHAPPYDLPSTCLHCNEKDTQDTCKLSHKSKRNICMVPVCDFTMLIHTRVYIYIYIYIIYTYIHMYT